MNTPRKGRRTAFAALTACAAIALPVALGLPAAAAASNRIYGDDRYATAVEVSKKTFKPGVPVVYIASGAGFADALSAAPAAALQGGPLLLVQPDKVPSVVRSEISRLKPSQIVVVGGTGAIDDDTYKSLATLATAIRRDAGQDRYETSRIVSDRGFAATTPVYGAFVATGQDFPDALSASAAAGALGVPVILVNGQGQSLDPTTQALMEKLGVGETRIAGGNAAVSPALEAGIKAVPNMTVKRYAGSDRYETSALINNDKNIYDNLRAETGKPITMGMLATGMNYADALSGGAAAGYQGVPLWVVPPTCVPAAVLTTGTRLGVVSYTLLGGPLVLTPGVESLATC